MSDDMREELLPCPFCGGTAELNAYIEQDGDFAEGCAMCTACQSEGPAVTCMDVGSHLPPGVDAEAAAISAWNSRKSQQPQGEALGYVLPSGIKQLKNDHPATIYAPDNAMVPGSHPVWLYDRPAAPAAVPDHISFESAEDLALWLEDLHSTTPDGAICANKWEPAQIAARAVREQPCLPASAAVPEGWEVEKAEAGGVSGFIVRSPTVDGVKSGTAVFEDSEDPAEQLLYFILQSSGAAS